VWKTSRTGRNFNKKVEGKLTTQGNNSNEKPAVCEEQLWNFQQWGRDSGPQVRDKKTVPVTIARAQGSYSWKTTGRKKKQPGPTQRDKNTNEYQLWSASVALKARDNNTSKQKTQKKRQTQKAPV